MDKFVVSARKYRPATFVSVVGQSHITSTLKNAIARNQLAHAYLFCGPRGVGKTTCARIFAKAINCMSPVDNEACGECESCRSFNEGRSFNIHELDAASNNSVDDIRSLTEQVRIPPQIGRYSVYIIDEVHMLSAQAFNAFLKTLEEPPAHAVFILATTEKHKIIPTILSRCQIFDFNRIRVEDAVEYLKYIAGQEGVAADDESLHLISLKADGGMRDALSMFDKAVSFCGNALQFKEVAQTLNVLDYDTYFNITSLIMAGDYPAVLTLFDEVLRKGFSPQSFAGGLNSHFRDLLMSKNPQTLPLLEVSGTLLERYKAQGAECPTEFLFQAIAVLTALDGTLRTATSQRLNVELGLMKLCGLGQKKNSDANVTAAPDLSETGKAELPPLRKEARTAVPVSTKEADIQPSTPSPHTQSKPEPKQPEAASHAANGERAGVAQAVTPESQKETLAAEPALPQEEQRERQATEPQPSHPAAQERTDPQPAKQAETDSPPAQKGQEDVPEIAADQNVPSAPDKQRPVRKSILAGNSIDAILNQPKNVAEAKEGGQESEVAQTLVDPDCERKITANKVAFLNEVHRERPRIAMALEEMEVAGNRISLKVPTETLYEEIMRNRTEILTILVDIAGIEGRLEFDVSIVEESKARKPIKVEDKLRFLTEKNPALTNLRKALNLEID